MRKAFVPVLAFTLLGILGPFAGAQEPASKPPTWKHGMELQARKAGEPEFTKDTKKYGVEVFRDENNGNTIYISETGHIAVLPGGAPAGGGEVKAPAWKHAMELGVRKEGEKEFTKDTKKFGVEVFLDENNSHGVYISETGQLAVAPSAGGGGAAKAPTWQHGLSLRVRKADEPDFNKDTKKFGVEVFRDENSGNTVYISETGHLAVLPGGAAGGGATADVKAPAWRYGLAFKVRPAGVTDFDKKAKKYGVEVFRDENNGNTVYISETGHLAVLPGGGAGIVEKVKAPTWKHAMELAVRKAGEAEFTKDTKRYGIEVYLDENSGNTIYVCETGDIAVVPKK
jgi:predicted peroxiredoxin